MTKGKLTNVVGDATDPQRVEPNEVVFLPHVCNSVNRWGSGVVIAISKKWKGAEFLYHNFFARYGSNDALGSTGFWDSDDNAMSDNVVVCNMIAQRGLKSENNPRPLDYAALVKCMKDVVDQIALYKGKSIEVPIRIHCPKFGSLRSGGDWNFILCLIEDIWLAAGISVVVYEFQE